MHVVISISICTFVNDGSRKVRMSATLEVTNASHELRLQVRGDYPSASLPQPGLSYGCSALDPSVEEQCGTV